jgi:uncharacterized protein YhaN
LKLLELRLLKYGPFTDQRLDFASGARGLHLIFGLNEAGKSTALRAISGLLFGIDENTTDAHLYAMSELRIGGHLENRAGERLTVIRRKGRKNTLLDIDDKPLDEGHFFRWWGGVSREMFETLFGLSHESLVRGGKDLLEGKGELGESLFGAALGARDFHEVRASLEKTASDIFRPRGEKQSLNRAMAAFREAKKRSAEKALKPADWQQCEAELRDLEQRRDQTVARRAALRVKLGHLERLGRALPVIRARQQSLERRQALGQVRLVDEACGRQRTAAQGALEEAEREERKLVDKRQRLEQALGSLEIRHAALEREQTLERLPERLGAHQKAQEDLPALRSRIALAKEDAAAIMKELGRSESLDEVDRLWVDAAARARIDKLAQESAALQAAAVVAKTALSNAIDEQQRWERELATRPEPPEARWLKQALQESQKQLHVEEQWRKLGAEIEAIDERVQTQLAALPLWRGNVDAARQLVLPQPETIEQFAAEMELFARQKERLEQRQATSSERLASSWAEMAALEARGAIVSERELSDARTRREGLWQQIKALWTDGNPRAVPPTGSMVSQYELGVQEADQVADRLWRDAERSARHAALVAERGRVEAEHIEVTRQLDALMQSSTERWRVWRQHWECAGIEPLRPVEMRGWLGRFGKLLESITASEEARRQRERLSEEIARQRGLCLAQLEALGQAEGAPRQSLTLLVERAQAVVERFEGASRARAQLVRDLERVAQQRQKAEMELERSGQAQDQWRERWASAVASLGLGGEAQVEEASAVLEGLSRLAQAMQKIRADQKRSDDIEEDARRFTDDILSLVNACAPELASLPTREAAERVYRVYQDARAALKRKGELQQQLDDNLQELHEVYRRRDEARTTLARLLQAAQCATVEELQESERRSREWRDLEAKLNDLEEQLAREGVALEELLRQAQQVDPDQIVGAMEALQPEIEKVDSELDNVQQQIGTYKQKLAQWEGGADAADAAAEAQLALADIKALAENYARIKLASSLLTREIERFREGKEGPILRRAGEMFGRMTRSRYAKLIARVDSQDRRRLMCVRNNGQEVPVEGLSDGTRDQLYLALRMASLEQHLALNEPLPMVLDDIFINFDDGRTRAALEILTETASHTQVLLFTHHARMLEIAREALAPDSFKEHLLGGLPTSS